MKHKQFGLVEIMALGHFRETLPPPFLIQLFGAGDCSLLCNGQYIKQCFRYNTAEIKPEHGGGFAFIVEFWRGGQEFHRFVISSNIGYSSRELAKSVARGFVKHIRKELRHHIRQLYAHAKLLKPVPA